MIAAYINEYGNVDNLVVGELPIPVMAQDQVLIKVVAAGVNPVDFHIRNGMLKDTNTHSLPLIMGWDTAGVIEKVGNKVKGFNVGDAVYVYSPLTEQGGQAEFMVVNANVVALKPASLSFIQSAAVPLAALTALQALTNEGQLKSGQKVLIHNGAGGVGSFAIQIAKHMGAYVIATGSQVKKDFILGLGADKFIDYKQDNFEQLVDAVDLVFAAVGGNNIVARSLTVLKPNGRLISVLDDIEPDLARAKNVYFNRMLVQPSREGLNTITDLIENKHLSITIDSVYALKDAKQAMIRSESTRATGKIVIEVSSE